MLLHPESWLDENRIGIEFPPYRPTFPYDGPFIDDTHSQLAIAPTNGAIIEIGIPGWLRPADALKLYEMAYFASGDILEFGSYHGLSTSIEAKAISNAKNNCHIFSLELDPHSAKFARQNTEQWSNLRTVIIGDARNSCCDFIAQNKKFDFAFIDHSHSYELVFAACEDLKLLLSTGSFALFHDFNDIRNGKCADYGVWQAVTDSFADGSFFFCGIYGCTGLWRRM